MKKTMDIDQKSFDDKEFPLAQIILSTAIIFGITLILQVEQMISLEKNLMPLVYMT